MYNWKGVDLSPESLAMSYNDNPDNYVTHVNGQFDCCDDEIKKFKDPIGLKIRDILSYDWKFLNNEEGQKDRTKYTAIVYTYNDNVLMGLKCIYDDYPNDAQMLVFITNEYFVIVGVVGEHPFVETPYLRYANSDGSGPNILKEINQEYLCNKLVKYYEAFISDEYH